MPKPLITTEAQLTTHFQRLEKIFESVCDISVQPQITVDSALSPVVAGLTGPGCEFVARNRGPRVPVAPLLYLHGGLWSWLSYREEWDGDEGSSRTRKLAFRTASITVYFGWRNDVFKPQMFRAEWSGWTRWDGVHHSFQAGDAGHPHWQFDAFDSLLDQASAERAALLRELLNDQAEGEVQEFSPQLANADVRDVVTSQKVSRIHFASAAAWWKPAPHDRHAHGPERLQDVQSWAQRSVRYLKGELEKLQGAQPYPSSA